VSAANKTTNMPTQIQRAWARGGLMGAALTDGTEIFLTVRCFLQGDFVAK
jgi:hypothetical protein